MQFLIFHSLIFHIIADRILIPMLPDSACEVTVPTEFASPYFLLHLGTALEHFSCSEAFYHRYDLSHNVCQNRLHQKMNMILICTNLQELHLISLLDIYTNFLQNIIHLIIKYYTPILGRKHQMVYQYRYIMTLMYVFVHTGILRRKQRGINPKGIKFTLNIYIFEVINSRIYCSEI